MSDTKVLALSLPGRSASTEERKTDALARAKGQKELEERVNKIITNKPSTASFAKLNLSDLVYGSEKLSFVGCGLHSNQLGFDYCIDQGAFATQTVVHVRDIFDLHEQLRPFLSSVFTFASNDAVLVNDVLFEALNRRLVNEYVRLPNGSYQLTRHDMEFVEYLDSLGFRVLHTNKTGEDFLKLASQYIPARQSTNHVLMVAPTSFVKNLQAAEDNYFMNDVDIKSEEAEEHKKNILLQRQVLKEYSELHRVLTEEAKIQVHLFTHESYHDTPDAVFPNNWFSTHTDFECGECTLVLYPMKVPNRRKERRPEFLARLESFERYTHVLDLTRQEKALNPCFLEGTGSLVLDRVNRIAYVVISERSDLQLAQKWGKILQYEVVAFHSTDSEHRAIYHTNVVMSVGTSTAVLCSESIEDPEERKKVLTRLRETGHEVVEITRDQMNHFCGNVLELQNWQGFPVMAMSTQAHDSFTPQQRETLLKHVKALIHADISTIERVGGGGVRCAIAELF